MLSSRPPILPIRPQPVNPRDLSEYAAIPIPDGDNNTEVLRAVKQVIDTLMRERGNFKASLITVQDLEDLGLISVTHETDRVELRFIGRQEFEATITTPPIAQMVSTSVTEVLAPGDIVAPFEIQWARDAVPDKTAGTILISVDGVYSVSFDISGTAAAANSEQVFTIRADGVAIAIIESVQKQSQEGVQAALVIRARLLAGQIVDVQMTGDSNMTAEHIVLSLAYHSSLLDIVES